MENQEKSLPELEASAQKWLMKDPDLNVAPDSGVELGSLMKELKNMGMDISTQDGLMGRLPAHIASLRGHQWNSMNLTPPILPIRLTK